MGQYSLLLMIATLVGGTLLMAQSNTTTIASNEKHAERQEELLAREIARSGYNIMLSAARDYERANPGASLEAVATAVNGGSADSWKKAGLNGGTYAAQLRPASQSSFIVVSNGQFGGAAHGVEEGHIREQTLVTNDEGTFKTVFIESGSTSCSAIYLQRMVPKNNNGHGNNVDGVDSSNPGGSKDGQDSDPTVDDEKQKGSVNSRYHVLEPELVYGVGKNRNGTAASYSTTLAAGTRVNFYIAVDKNCSESGRTDLPLTSSKYDYYHPALANPAGAFEEIEEGKYAMIQRHPNNPNKWRVAFEDVVQFTDAQHADVKKNGYGDMKWSKRDKNTWSYGGAGWSLRDSWGYFDLLNRSDMPDFADQVFEIEFQPTASSN